MLDDKPMIYTNHGITNREVEIIDHLSQGLTTKEISGILQISCHTVISHKKNLMKKLKARNTTHMVVKAIHMLYKLLFCLMFVALCTPCRGQIDLTNGLVAYYPFNDNANDESGNGYNGDIFGAIPTTDRFGNSNSAYSFDGVNDFISISDPFYEFEEELSVSCWIKIESNSIQPGAGIGQSISNVSDWNTNVWHVHAHPDSYMSFYVVDSEGEEFNSGKANLQKFQWHHYLGIATSDFTEIYFDGVLQSSTAGHMSSINNISTSVIHIGKDPRFSTGRYLEGIVDEIRIYNRALTADEITTLYTSGVNISLDEEISVLPPSPQKGEELYITTVVRNEGSCNWTGDIVMQLLSGDGSNLNDLTTPASLSLSPGEGHRLSFSTNEIINDAGDYQIRIQFQEDGSESLLNVGASVYTNPVRFSILPNDAPDVDLKINAFNHFNVSDLITGETYAYKVQVENCGISTWSGRLYLRVNGQTPLLLGAYNIDPFGGRVIIDKTFIPESNHEGEDVIVQLQYLSDVGEVIVNGGDIPNPFTANIRGLNEYPYWDYGAGTPSNNSRREVQVGNTLSIDLKAEDSDVGDIVTITAISPLLGGSLILNDPSNIRCATFEWTPTTDNLGLHEFSFIATDDAGHETPLDLNVFVHEAHFSYDLIHYTRIDNQMKKLLSVQNDDGSANFRVCADGAKNTSVFEIKSIDGSDISKLELRLDPGSIPDIHGSFERDKSSDKLEYLYHHPVHYDSEYALIDFQLYNSATALVVGNFEIEVYKAPVLLVHGWGGGLSTFENFEYYLIDSDRYESFLIDRVEYTYDSDRGIDVRTLGVVPDGIKGIQEDLVSEQIACGRVDVVAHSMGGLVTRYYTQSEIYGKNIRRIITINTPHSGTPVANYALQEGPVIYDEFGIPHDVGFQTFLCALVPLALENNSCGESVIDMQYNSDFINTLNSSSSLAKTSIPSHAIATHLTFEEIVDQRSPGGGVILDVANELFLMYGGIILNYYLPLNRLSRAYSTMFDSELHDGVVGVISQHGGLSGNNTTTYDELFHLGTPDDRTIQLRLLSLLIHAPTNEVYFNREGFSPPILDYDIPSFTSEPLAYKSSFSLDIIEPLDGAILTVGDTMEVLINSTGVDVIVGIFEYDENRIWRTESTDPNPFYSIKIGPEMIGNRSILAIGHDTLGNRAIIDTMTYTVLPLTIPGYLSILPVDVNIVQYGTKEITVYAHYDSVDVNITHQGDLDITIINSKVDFDNGFLYAFDSGTDYISATWMGVTSNIAQINIELAEGCYDIDDLNLSDLPLESGIYESYFRLSTQGSVAEDQNVVFRAGNEILLGPGFTVNKPSLFEAQIEDCDLEHIYGCTIDSSHNYNPFANQDDGSCLRCDDGILNGDEEEIDCGGENCDPCI